MNSEPIFITGIGTDIGKTIVSAIVTKALEGDYWKPIQAGFDKGTDKQLVEKLVNNSSSIFHQETYLFEMPASPHIAANKENTRIDIEKIKANFNEIQKVSTSKKPLIIEGVGGLLVPINEKEFIIDIIEALSAKVILVSRNYLGSINHSLLTAQMCKQRNINVLGWIFNDQYLNYEDEIVQWSGYPKIGSIPLTNEVSTNWIAQQASLLSPQLVKFI